MKRPNKLDGWDFTDSIQVPDGYGTTRIPDLTRDNFIQLVEEYNNLVEVVNLLLDYMEEFGDPKLEVEP